jgi:hypothetical protein
MATNKKSQMMMESQLTSRNCQESAQPECLSNRKAGGELDNDKNRITNGNASSQHQSVEEDNDEEMSEEMTGKVTNRHEGQNQGGGSQMEGSINEGLTSDFLMES